ncbi:MAG: SoxR reducing system RseC family protein [Betaproteobacteria bacterium]
MTEHEGIARVVAVEADHVWLEPVQTGGCGACSAAQSCGSNEIGTLANRLATKRFFVEARGFAVGEQVAVTFGEQNLVRMATLAYAIPLLTSLSLAMAIEFYAGQDTLTLLGAVIGLALGFGITKSGATRLLARGKMQPGFVRRIEEASPHQEGN